VKGAPEIILSRASYALCENGKSVVSDLSYVREEYHKAVSGGERVIAVALSSKGEERLTFICLAVLKDKLRDGVRDAVSRVMKSGIQIVMVTGDNKDTATGIAEECGFYKMSAGHIAVNSDELSQLTDSEVKKLLPKIRVVSRALPQDKTRLVRLSQELDLVVGMTGDGINDAPSLKLADVGFSMGSGTDIAKSAGDIVILDNSFNAICKTILYGRTIFKSIRKFITFQLIMNLAACGITLIGRFIGVDTPITIIQMLWVNIIMDTLGGLAFAGEAPMNYYMKEKPKKRDEPLLNRDMIWQILLNGGFTLALLVLFLTHPFFRGIFPDMSRRLTAFYALFIFSGLFNCLSARSERLWILHGILKNRLFIGIMMFITVIQILIVYFGGGLFRSTPLTAQELFLTVAVAFSVLMFDSVRRVMCKLK
jgi:calcium-translocating P-type ATPase